MRRKLDRRQFLKLGGQGALLLMIGGAAPLAAKRWFSGSGSAEASRRTSGLAADAVRPAANRITRMHLAATDGFISLPGRDPLYIFGFVDVPLDASANQLDRFKGRVQTPAPTIWMDEETDIYLTLSNIGLVIRPDLDDAHTIHWHGFRNQIAIFDGLPEASISVPPGRSFPYFYRPHEEGTYMYHCHFEDTEHVQMGMVGVIFVRPKQNGRDGAKFAYNDGLPLGHPASSAFDREFALFLQDVWTLPHDNLVAVQESLWTDYDANYWTINGRAYPDTLKPNIQDSGADPALRFQPISSLIQVNEGERVLLRMANLGFELHTMQLAGIPMKVIGEDASYLGPLSAPVSSPLPASRPDITYVTNSVYIGPGEARDVLFTAPRHSGRAEPDVYLFKNRNLQKLSNGGVPGLGGMATEVRVYPRGTLPAQANPNDTYAV